ncbi:MAG TPA: helicase-related protein [Gaiella sp.]|uniref:helicase-related protein n=1 Tax=Gaiella sp. TaxID=2663207 RepID=UPI002D7E7D0D|nr:helicase-related protein [Gaiella sp.]HET9287777.1 helicase-related protein [Gaiella sp.]
MPRSRRSRPPRRPSRSARHARATGAYKRAAVKRAEDRIEIRLPERRTPPESVVAHLGPTNSGKTHDALGFLAESGRGVYAGPLRMLAQEAHRRLSAQLGEGRVGLVTGEERVNEHAPILCCTVEMAPGSGEVLVLDEVQWADDEERGAAWTQLLLAGEYRHVRLLGALDALPLVRRAFPHAELRVHERKLPLEFVGARQLRGLAVGTVVVAFSRKAVLALAGEINRLHPDKVAVLYGAMPLASRREEIDRFLSGAADVCVATDVLGHGVNLPCETLLFAETTKFDGEARRNLLPWELAQIAGRAGRFGLVERGHVGVLVGVPWASADPELVESALEPHVQLPEGYRGYRIVDEARIGPRLGDLGIDDPRDLDAALAAWHRVATRQWAHESWLAVESLQPIRGRLAVVERHLRSRGRRLGLDETWQLVNAPIDPDGAELLGVLALAVAGDRAQRPLLQFLLDTSRLRDASLEEAEEAGRVAAILRWFALQYLGVGGVTMERAAALEQAAAERVVRRLSVEVRDGKLGRCRSCGRTCPPWYPLCDRCARSGRR